MPRPAPPVVLVALGLALACDQGPLGGGSAPDDRHIVARIDGQPITLADLQKRMAQQTPYVQARYASPERRKELLDNLIRFEILAREARKRGYERDPQVLRHQQQRLVDRMVAEELDARLKAEDIPEAELRRFYQEHAERFTRPEAVRVSQILVGDATAAARVAAAARALGARDDRGFRRLVAAHSLDEDSKQRGGDLTFLERQPAGGGGDAHRPPPAVVEAAFGLTEVGQIAGPIESDRGFHVLRLGQRRPAALRPFEEVAAEVRQLVLEGQRSRRLDEWVAEMRNKVNIQVYEDKLRDVAATP
jgi:peptidyl-prolyl cis-trans isomerase C